MQKLLFSFGLLGWQAYAQHPVNVGGQVCYEVVKVITYVHPGGAPSPTCDVCDEDAGGNPEGPAKATVTVPGVSVPAITEPVTTTYPPLNGEEDSSIVVVRTPVSTPDDGYVAIITPNTEEPPATTAVTSVIPPDGTEPGTTIIETPIFDPDETYYIEIISTDTNEPTDAPPSTSIIPPNTKLHEPGTIIVVLPPDEPATTTAETTPAEPTTSAQTTPEEPTTTSEEPTTTSVETTTEEPTTPTAETTFPPPTTDPVTTTTTPEPTTSDEPTTSLVPTTTIVDPPGPTFSCDAGGFLIQRKTLYRIDLQTGDINPVKDTVSPDTGNINAMGYNIKDNFLYAFTSIGNDQQQLIRIDATGESILLPLKVEAGLNVGDIDDQGHMWASDGGRRWIQVDLDPASDTYAMLVNEGRSSGGGTIADWVFLENGGRYLYSIKVGGSSVAERWSMDTHDYEVLRDYGNTVPGNAGFGALYAVGDELWGSDNQSGDIIAFPVLSDSAPAEKITDGPSTSSNDGARCYEAPPPGSDDS